jgi:hypothetical protein
MQNSLNLKIYAGPECLTISGDLYYSCMYDMYRIDGVLRDGEGLQVNEDADEEKAKVLSRAIAKAVKQYLEPNKHENIPS